MSHAFLGALAVHASPVVTVIGHFVRAQVVALALKLALITLFCFSLLKLISPRRRDTASTRDEGSVRATIKVPRRHPFARTLRSAQASPGSHTGVDVPAVIGTAFTPLGQEQGTYTPKPRGETSGRAPSLRRTPPIRRSRRNKIPATGEYLEHQGLAGLDEPTQLYSSRHKMPARQFGERPILPLRMRSNRLRGYQREAILAEFEGGNAHMEPDPSPMYVFLGTSVNQPSPYEHRTVSQVEVYQPSADSLGQGRISNNGRSNCSGTSAPVTHEHQQQLETDAQLVEAEQKWIEFERYLDVEDLRAYSQLAMLSPSRSADARNRELCIIRLAPADGSYDALTAAYYSPLGFLVANISARKQIAERYLARYKIEEAEARVRKRDAKMALAETESKISNLEAQLLIDQIEVSISLIPDDTEGQQRSLAEVDKHVKSHKDGSADHVCMDACMASIEKTTNELTLAAEVATKLQSERMESSKDSLIKTKALGAQVFEALKSLKHLLQEQESAASQEKNAEEYLASVKGPVDGMVASFDDMMSIFEKVD